MVLLLPEVYMKFPSRFSLLDLVAVVGIVGILAYYSIGFGLLFVEPLPEPTIQVYWEEPRYVANRIEWETRLALYEGDFAIPYEAWLELADGDWQQAERLRTGNPNLVVTCGRYQLDVDVHGHAVRIQ